MTTTVNCINLLGRWMRGCFFTKDFQIVCSCVQLTPTTRVPAETDCLMPASQSDHCLNLRETETEYRARHCFVKIQLSKSDVNTGFVTCEALQGIFTHHQHQYKIIVVNLQNRCSGREVNG